MQRVIMKSPAKLNLFLELHRRREDGFHELETVMVAIDRCDQLSITRRDDSELNVTAQWSPSQAAWEQQLPGMPAGSLDLPQGEGNLVYQAVQRFRQRCQIKHGFDIHIEKTIPAGAGMGGASSNAACSLRGVAKLSQIPLSDARIRQTAAEIGSDVPFFLGPTTDQDAKPEGSDASNPLTKGSAALATGRGEQLAEVALAAPISFVVCFPPHPLSTAAVYSICQVPVNPCSAEELLSTMAKGPLEKLSSLLFNRLGKPASTICPPMADLLESMRSIGLNGCQLTGSGSACFGIAESLADANRIATELSKAGYPVSFAASPLPLPTPLQ
ncbi:4-diphosphocytidyl-2-C-methyl-D-erythritol kinase [Roseimaritima multifibrata]|uniref:4-diphosphocytidyl-2-C-methyl-D-erythritol kinase n=2 Tax=Roseimaritima multifibrata TaxID=1930274 RepID=A0A517ML17_9BACT|nr:4-diphosphocytidyl-2-C-methyl-D-erythritol kinase [Roseimaritima multifibrata]